MKIVLCSTSPRRRKLLADEKWKFTVLEPGYEETPVRPSRVLSEVKNHALGKALSAAARVKNGIVLGADTVVYLPGEVIGKPKDMKHAVTTLSKLQGRWHTVITGVAVIKVLASRVVKKKVFHEKTRVYIKKMTPEEISGYFKRINPLDKAGAYAIQTKKYGIVSKLEGSFTNAVGLPMEKLGAVLRQMNCDTMDKL